MLDGIPVIAELSLYDVCVRNRARAQTRRIHFATGVVRICISRQNRIRIHADAVYLITDKSLN